MAIRLTTTQECGKFVKVLIFGRSGVGKTKLIKTAPKPIIISGEKGLFSLKNTKIPVIEVHNHLDLKEAFDFVTTSPKCKGFQTVALDSVSEIAENTLQYFKDNPPDGNPDPRAAYNAMIDELMPLFKMFRDINDKHIYFIAQLKRVEDQYTGIDSFSPGAPGKVIGPKLPYWFDFVLPMRIGEKEGGKKYRYLQTQPCLQYTAKSRGDNLRDMEPPNLTKLFAKVLSADPGAGGKGKGAATDAEKATAAANAEKQAKIKEEAELNKAAELAKKKKAEEKRKADAAAKTALAKKKKKEEKADKEAAEQAEAEKDSHQKEEEEAAELANQEESISGEDAASQAAIAALSAAENGGAPEDELDGFGLTEGEGDGDDFPGSDGEFPE